MAELLTDAEREAGLAPLGQSGWAAVPEQDAIRKIFKFKNFSEAWAFMARVALAAEKANHHPEWTNVYNVVDVTLTTHSAKGLTRLDLDLAQKLDLYGASAQIQTDHGAPIECLCGGRQK